MYSIYCTQWVNWLLDPIFTIFQIIRICFFFFFLNQMVENRNQQNQVCVHHNNPHVWLVILWHETKLGMVLVATLSLDFTLKEVFFCVSNQMHTFTVTNKLLIYFYITQYHTSGSGKVTYKLLHIWQPLEINLWSTWVSWPPDWKPAL